MRPLRACCALILAVALDAGAAPLPNVVISNGLAPPNPANVINAANSLPNNSLWVVAANCDPYVSGCDIGGPRTQVSIEAGGVVGGNLTIDDGMEWNLYSHYSHVTVNGGSILGDVFNSVGLFTVASGEVAGLARMDFASMDMTGGNVGSVGIIHGLFTMSGGSVLGDVGGEGTYILLGGSVGGDLKVGGASANNEWHGGTLGGTLFMRDAFTTTIFGTGFAIDGVPVSYGDVTAFSGLLTGTLENGDPIHNAFTGNAINVGNRFTLSAPVPEPSAVVLVGAGLGLIAAARRRAA